VTLLTIGDSSRCLPFREREHELGKPPESESESSVDPSSFLVDPRKPRRVAVSRLLGPSLDYNIWSSLVPYSYQRQKD
jgi:hypothetical protein